MLTRHRWTSSATAPLIVHWSVLVVAIIAVNPLGLTMPAALKTLASTAGLPVHAVPTALILGFVTGCAAVAFGCARAVATTTRRRWRIRSLVAALVLLSILRASVASSSGGQNSFEGSLPAAIGAVVGYGLGFALLRSRGRKRTSASAQESPESTRRDPGTAPRRLLGAQIAVAVTCGLVAVAGLPVLVFPSVDPLERSDVAVVLGPATPERVALAHSLVTDGTVSGIVISTVGDEDARPIECRPPGSGIVCIHAVPFTTRGEADGIRLLASEKGWRSLVVITSTPHISRAKVVFDSCTEQRISMLPVPTGLSAAEWVYAYLYQGGAFLKMLAVPPCAPGQKPPSGTQKSASPVHRASERQHRPPTVPDHRNVSSFFQPTLSS
ncbi:hypothetical protein SAMN06295885_1029 [Rathayibacter oskolensis]|uniref:DUF218 domain-containing protein n=1 Tax=Rathayibacter oskolensis TaxID=1891671 RepID=A0A1X7NAY9_9MICO|nr:hypothetical protein SAMN06295885_1029 [Rathayibacter oskolensis]